MEEVLCERRAFHQNRSSHGTVGSLYCVETAFSTLPCSKVGRMQPPPGIEILVCFNTRYVPGQNFLVSQPISTILGALESTGSPLSKTLKIVEIGSEMTKS